MASVLGGDTVEMEEMSPCLGLFELTRKTQVVSSAPFEGGVGSTKDGIGSMTSSTKVWIEEDSWEVV